MVDDHAELLEAMVTLLAYSGYTVHTARDNKTFLTEFEKFKPGIVLIDVKLGAEDGRQICKYFRKDHEDVALILMSVSASNLENFVAYGADAAIEKPFEPENLKTTIEAAVKSRKEKFNTKDI